MYRDIENNACFIIGHARTGTTITHYSINLHPKAFLYGEASFCLDQSHHRNGFRSWYTRLHQSKGIRATKGIYSFNLPVATDSWSDHCRELVSRGFTVVGDKVGLPPNFMRFIPHVKMFFERNFLAGKYVLTFRPPIQAIESSQLLFPDAGLPAIKASYAQMLFFQTDILSCFPNVHALFFDSKTEIDAEGLFNFLGLDYREDYNVFRKAPTRQDTESSLYLDPDVSALGNIYTILREVVLKERDALEQRVKQPGAPIGFLQKTALDMLHRERLSLGHLSDPAMAFV